MRDSDIGKKVGYMLSSQSRFIGVDIAKIVAMFLVVAVHVDNRGLPFCGNHHPDFIYQLVRSLANTMFMTCIDIFAIASGFVGVTSRFRWGRILKFWFQIVFTGLVVLACMHVFTDVPVNIKDYFKACAPIAMKQYWYMTCYMMLAFMLPLINAGLKAMSKKMFMKLLVALLLVITTETFLLSGNALGVGSGYSFAWLLILYLVGAYIRLYGHPFGSACRVTVYAVTVLFISTLWVCFKKIVILPKAMGHLGFVGYTSPFTVVLALFIFVLCLAVKVESEKIKKIIATAASVTLGVYLIHSQPLFFEKIFVPTCKYFKVTGAGDYLLTLGGIVLVTYIACSLCDYARSRLLSVAESLFHVRAKQ